MGKNGQVLGFASKVIPAAAATGWDGQKCPRQGFLPGGGRLRRARPD